MANAKYLVHKIITAPGMEINDVFFYNCCLWSKEQMSLECEQTLLII